jgi:hypothetical protein
MRPQDAQGPKYGIWRFDANESRDRVKVEDSAFALLFYRFCMPTAATGGNVYIGFLTDQLFYMC